MKATKEQARAARAWGFRPGALVLTVEGDCRRALTYPYVGVDGQLRVMVEEPTAPTGIESYALPPEVLDLLEPGEYEIVAGHHRLEALVGA